MYNCYHQNSCLHVCNTNLLIKIIKTTCYGTYLENSKLLGVQYICRKQKHFMPFLIFIGFGVVGDDYRMPHCISFASNSGCNT